MPNNLFDPHFYGFPSSESRKEVEFLDFFINLFLFKPFLHINKFNWFTTIIMTKSFFTDCIVFKIRIFIFRLNLLIINDF